MRSSYVAPLAPMAPTYAASTFGGVAPGYVAPGGFGAYAAPIMSTPIQPYTPIAPHPTGEVAPSTMQTEGFNARIGQYDNFRSTRQSYGSYMPVTATLGTCTYRTSSDYSSYYPTTSVYGSYYPTAAAYNAPYTP